MPLSNYSAISPGVKITQNLSPSAVGAAEEIAVVAVGPKYVLSRYGRETTPGTDFNAAGQTLNYKRIIDDVIQTLDLELFSVDTDSIRVYGKNLEAALATFTAAGSPSFTVPVLTAPHEIKISAGAVKGTSLATAFRGRSSAIGDVVVVTPTNGATPYKRRITGFRGVTGAGTYGSDSGASNSEAANNNSNPENSTASATQVSAPTGWSVTCANPEAFNGLAQGAKTVNNYGEEFIITVHTAGAPGVAKVNITSVGGGFAATEVATTDESGNFGVADADAGGELGGVDLLLTKPVGGSLSIGMSFRIRIVGDYERLDATQVVVAGTYAGTFDTTLVATVIANGSGDTNFTGAIIEVTDTAGREVPTQVTITDNTAVDLGTQGLTIKFHGSGQMPAQAGLRVGDSFYIHARAGAVSTSSFDTVILDGPVVDTLTWTDEAVELYSVAFRVPFTGEIAVDDHSGGTAWEANEDNVTLLASLDTNIQSRDNGYEWCPFVTAVGEIHLSYRAIELVADGAHGFAQVAEAADLEAAAGVADSDNPLGLAAQWQIIGSGGRPIYILNTGGTAAANYTAALDAVQHSTLGYEFLVVDSSADVRTAVQTHVATASSAARNTQRRARFAIESPGTYLVLGTRSDTTNFTATVTPYGGGNKLVTVSAGSDESALLSRGIVAGYTFEVNGDSFAIAEVISDTEMLLEIGTPGPVDPAVAFTIKAADTVASQKSYLKTLAEGTKDRRITLCWSERPYGSDGAVLPVLAGAAYVSGLRSALPAQVGLTRQAVAPFAGTRMSRYTNTDLDEIAAAGITILNQNNTSLPVRVRHQLTTDSSGVLNIEESTTVRLDVLCRRLYNVYDELLGRINTTDRAVELIRAETLRVLTGAREVPTLDVTYGPLIDGFADLVVSKNASILSRIDVRFKVAIGPPVNRIEVIVDTYAELPAV